MPVSHWPVNNQLIRLYHKLAVQVLYIDIVAPQLNRLNRSNKGVNHLQTVMRHALTSSKVEA